MFVRYTNSRQRLGNPNDYLPTTSIDFYCYTINKTMYVFLRRDVDGGLCRRPVEIVKRFEILMDV